MAMTAEEANRFYNLGRDIMTKLAQAADDADSYSRKFEVEGGALGMAEMAAETGQIIQFFNDLNTFLASNNGFPQNMLDLHRHDY